MVKHPGSAIKSNPMDFLGIVNRKRVYFDQFPRRTAFGFYSCAFTADSYTEK
ncbi:hypothetical protein ADIS_3128 [Lunatimonas lonarensis]|uniref:Uncharacterized protein n=1 Tax=Lunatimonas lonarensis TaxID=1232681 RepID=R7ZRK4_9BACT|nr:hypothetical protein ADIS_3128 [Lunatimonas lonarensis]